MLCNARGHLLRSAPCQDDTQPLQQASVGGHDVAVIAPPEECSTRPVTATWDDADTLDGFQKRLLAGCLRLLSQQCCRHCSTSLVLRHTLPAGQAFLKPWPHDALHESRDMRLLDAWDEEYRSQEADGMVYAAAKDAITARPASC